MKLYPRAYLWSIAALPALVVALTMAGIVPPSLAQVIGTHTEGPAYEDGPLFNCADWSGGDNADTPMQYDLTADEAEALAGEGWRCGPNVADLIPPWQKYDCYNPETGDITRGLQSPEWVLKVRDEGNACVYPGEPFRAGPGEIDTYRGPAGPITDDGVNR